MRLQDAAAFFDKTVVADAYTPTRIFRAQLDVFDDSKRDGATVLRRVLSVGPDVRLPARGAVKLHGDYYIVGAAHTDAFNGQLIRSKYVVEKADGLAQIRTRDQAALGAGGVSAYAGRLWVKDLKEPATSAGLYPFFNLYLSAAETVPAGAVIVLGGRHHLVRASFVSAGGFLLAEADELPADCLQTVQYTSTNGVYDAANDVMVTGGAISVPILWHRFQDDYVFLSDRAAQYSPGDIAVSLSSTTVGTPRPTDTFVLQSTTYRVLSARGDGAGWILHCRRA